jgi:hypothetical protein
MTHWSNSSMLGQWWRYWTFSVQLFLCCLSLQISGFPCFSLQTRNKVSLFCICYLFLLFLAFVRCLMMQINNFELIHWIGQFEGTAWKLNWTLQLYYMYLALQKVTFWCFFLHWTFLGCQSKVYNIMLYNICCLFYVFFIFIFD